MGRSGERSQGDVLADRFRRVPWRRVVRHAIRERIGNGPAERAERLEGAVFGQLVGDDPGPGATGDAGGSAMLAFLDEQLAERSGPGDDLPAGGVGGRLDHEARGSLADVLPIPLVWRDRVAADVADRAARASAAGPSGGGAPLARALYALLIRRLLAGEHGRTAVLDRATADLRSTLSARGLPDSPREAQPAIALAALDAVLGRAGDAATDPAVAGFWAGWDAFARSSGYEEAVIHAGASDRGSRGAAVAGGLAGVRWGSSAIPTAWRRALPEGPLARRLVDRLIETDEPGWDGEPWRTSTSDPMRLDRLDLSGVDGAAGKVGITSLPGRRYVGYHTGAHWRDLDTDAARLRELGLDLLLLLVEDAELVRCRVTGIGEALAAQGIELVRFPIRDPLLPRDGIAFRATVASLLRRVCEGGSVAIACRGGLDRAGMTSACLLREAGLPADGSIERVQRARRGALTLPDQQAYVRAWPPR